MLFHSVDFLIFLPIVVTIYFNIAPKWRWACLLIASYVFYAAWKPSYLLLIVFSTIVDYCAGIYLEASSSHSRKRLILGASLAANLGLLFIFKYYNFFVSSLDGALLFLGAAQPLPYLDLILPIGISFYTFQTLSYTIDVYRGQRKAERHFGIFALYVSFFPQLVAGPIERSARLLPQFYKTYQFEYPRVASGLRLMLWGFFKKLVIADRLAMLVNDVYAKPEAYPGPVLILATLFFAFQIYCDFSGYSDIAIGTARIMGFELMQNFRSPYFAKSITEFWQRWHISLSTWFRDYVYIPLGGNRGSPGRTNLNLLVVFLLSGIWHGAEWSFVLWGAFHGVLLIAERFSRSAMRSLGLSSQLFVGVNALRTLLCFALVCLSWVFFRAETVQQAYYIYGHMFEGWHVLSDLRSFFQSLPATYAPGHLLISVCALTLLVSIEYQIKETSFCKWLETKSTVARWLVYYVLFLAILLFRQPGSQEFIYFQF